LFKTLLIVVLRLLYRVKIAGAENFALAGERTVIVINHVSFLDAVLVAAFLPGRPTFAINTLQARKWYIKPFLKLVDAFPLDPTNPMSTKSLIRVVQAGRPCVIFPEGRLTVTGSLMKIYEGPGMIADKAAATLLPIRIDGAQYTPFSHLKGKVPIRWFPRVTITVLPPCKFAIPATSKGRARRQQIGLALYDVMSRTMFETTNHSRTLFQALLNAQHLYGAKTPIIEDVTRTPLSYGKLVLGSLVLGRRFAKLATPGEAVGVLLPNVAAAPVVFFGLQLFGRVPAMLNFSAGPASSVAAVKAAQIKTIITSRRFIEQARLEPTIAALGKTAQVIYLEDIRAGLKLGDKLYGLLARPFAANIHRRTKRTPHDPAVILFTSGSEGTPKGVVLSAYNILANCHQLGARIAFSPADIVFNAMPVFHSFGLTGGLLLPLFSGIRTFLYPSPLHYRIVPELVYDTNATVFFGTDTFLAGYARVANPYDFYSVRYVVAGAERVKDETRRVWMEKFGLRILEGYGATETAPVLAINTPMHFRAGTVGRLLPGIEYRLAAVPGIEEGGRLFVRGPNIMRGYLRAENPGVLEAPVEGWYDTGDIVTVDEQGYVKIAGRAKRFAKIAGEMVSLGRVEAEITALWPENQHAVVAIEDERKGEQMVLLTDRPDADRAAIQTQFRTAGLSDIHVPKTVRMIERLPLLGTGKIDYVAAKKLAE
jgi:acyl-[acyl-carrier-protein]-phospholipid O-acyltransferase/long-chain-fatty-acid--[acyl-carrier-protein] ligase